MELAPAASKGPQRMIELAEGEMWTDFLEEINNLLIQEKKARHELDSIKLAEICTVIIQISFDKGEHVRMREFLLMLCKRRGQAKKPVTEMIALCMEKFMGQLPQREDKFTLLKTLCEACDGKMFLEREYSKCIRMQVEMMEADGKIDEAAKLIQEIQIETYGSLESKEKVDFILYQMKLVLMRQDFVRTQILSRKISRKAISEKGLESQKIEYFNYMIEYYIQEKDVLQVSKSYQIIFDTLKAADEELYKQLDPQGNLKSLSFRNFVLYLLVSAYGNEKVDLLNKVEAMYIRDLDEEQLISKFVKKFLTFELMPLNENEIEQQVSQYEPFLASTKNSKLHMREFLRQLIQHNVRVIEKYYSRIRLERLASLVGVSVDRAEMEIGDMVVNKRISAKINRLSGIVNFSKRKQFTDERLNGWNYDIRNILEKVETTCHLINRENVVHS